MSLEMAHKVIVPPKKIMSRSFLNSGTLIVILKIIFFEGRICWQVKAGRLSKFIHHFINFESCFDLVFVLYSNSIRMGVFNHENV
jgi:hypothetical protein